MRLSYLKVSNDNAAPILEITEQQIVGSTGKYDETIGQPRHLRLPPTALHIREKGFFSSNTEKSMGEVQRQREWEISQIRQLRKRLIECEGDQLMCCA